MMTAPRALMILGPTASGKTDLAVRLALRFHGEVVSMDSALVYRGMDIGTAKPTLEERHGVPHHLIDIREIGESYSAADFAADAARLVEDIAARGRLPIIAGGTMLYAKALRDGLNDMPTTAPEVRDSVADEAERLGWPAMHAKLAQVDPVTAARLAPNDKQRIGRALEVYRMTGRPLSSFHAKRTADEAAFPVRALGLLPGDRAELHRRIGLRFERMLEAGFLDEVRGLMARPDFREESPAMRAVGYRQAIDFLRGRTKEAVFREAGCAATRQLAKRQMTWMRSMSDVTLVDPWLESAEDRGAMLAEDVERALGL